MSTSSSSSSTEALPPSRLRERLLASLSKSSISKAGKIATTSASNVSSVAPLAPASAIASSAASSSVAIPSSPPRSKSIPPQAKTTTISKNQKKQVSSGAHIDRPPTHHLAKKDQPQRLLKRLPQAKVLGDVDLEQLMKNNDLVVVINDQADEIVESSSFDASVADEKDGLRKAGFKSALITSSNQLKLSKKVMFIGGERDGEEVSAIYLYEAVPVDVPWQAPKFRGDPVVKAAKSRTMPLPPMSAAITFRAC